MVVFIEILLFLFTITALALLFYWPSKNKGEKRRYYLVIGAGVGMILAIVILKYSGIDGALKKRFVVKSHLDQKFEETLTASTAPRHVDMLRGKSQAQLQELVTKGMARLSVEDLLKWNRFRLKLAEKSRDVCASFWNGRIDSNFYMGVLKKMPNAAIDEFVTLSIRALLRELDREPAQIVNAKEVRTAFTALSESMNEEEQKRFAEAMTLNMNDKDQACWAMKQAMQFIDKNQQKKEAVDLVKYMAITLGGI